MYQYRFEPSGNIIKINVSPFPDWQEFEAFAEMLMDNESMQLVDCDKGMDRFQYRLTWRNERYLLQYEHYTDSIWLEREND